MRRFHTSLLFGPPDELEKTIAMIYLLGVVHK